MGQEFAIQSANATGTKEYYGHMYNTKKNKKNPTKKLLHLRTSVIKYNSKDALASYFQIVERKNNFSEIYLLKFNQSHIAYSNKNMVLCIKL